MAQSLQKISVVSSSISNKSGQQIADSLYSEEIMFGFAGAIGCGISNVVKKTISTLEAASYQVHHIKISTIIKNLYKKGKIFIPFDTDCDNLLAYERYTFLQDCGNKLREIHDPSILADAVISEIALIRKDASKNPEEKDQYIRRAYLIDQLKNPDEITTLRLLYGDSFYLVGVLSSNDDRLANLRNERIQEPNALSLIHRDKDDNDKFGQRLQKTLFNADYFIRYTNSDMESLTQPIERFINLIHGQKGVTPTLQETGMFAAYTASLSSACLSRQVGAAISSEDGSIISTGCNDAPASGGGLYTADHSIDLRCYRKGGYCSNHKKQKELIDDITAQIVKHDISPQLAQKIAHGIKNNTRISSLTEFSRAIHAEMDAILKVARRDSTSTKNSTLYTTTYPCHNCARHIVAAGMKKVIYIEPYEKSLALELHDDAITTDERNSEIPNSSRKKLVIVQFEGVAPSRYEAFFKYKKDTKIDGLLNNIPLKNSKQLEPLFAEAYHQIEKRILDNYVTVIESKAPIDVNPDPHTAA